MGQIVLRTRELIRMICQSSEVIRECIKSHDLQEKINPDNFEIGEK